MSHTLDNLGVDLRQQLEKLIGILQPQDLNATPRTLDAQSSQDQSKSVYEILESLQYASMKSREAELRDDYQAYPDTFEWLYDGCPNASWPSLSTWLTEGEQLYLISGKPGSGKSTVSSARILLAKTEAHMSKLVSFLIHHAKFLPFLRPWAANSKLLTPAFFFWRAGDRYQHSLGGLVRSLLHQLVSTHPPFAKYLVDLAGNVPRWTDRNLLQCLRQICQHLLIEKVKVCFVVDGLDECSGDVDSEQALMDLISYLARTTNTKVIISSRPEQYFEDTFSQYRRLCLHELTFGDINNYVRLRLLAQPRTSHLFRIDWSGSTALIEDICQKADGVFLWVRLAVQNIVKGLRNGDTLGLLRNRVEMLDPTLDGLIPQLLKRVDTVYRPLAASYLRFATAMKQTVRWDSKLSLSDFIFAYHPDLALNILSIFDSDAVDSGHAQSVLEKMLQICKELRTRSAYLLEITSPGCPQTCPCARLHIEQDATSFACRVDCCDFKFACVHFFEHVEIGPIHRSILDYLQNDASGKAFIESAVEDIPSLVLKALQGAVALSTFFCADYLIPMGCMTKYHAVDARSTDFREYPEQIVRALRMLGFFSLRRERSCHSSGGISSLTKISHWLGPLAAKQGSYWRDNMRLQLQDFPMLFWVARMPNPDFFWMVLLECGGADMVLKHWVPVADESVTCMFEYCTYIILNRE